MTATQGSGKGEGGGSQPGDLCEQPPTRVSEALVGRQANTSLLTQRIRSWLLYSLTSGALGGCPIMEEPSFPSGLV